MSLPTTSTAEFDPLIELTKHAPHLNALNSPSSSNEVFYDIMSDGLAWRDETDGNTPVRVVWALRFIIAYRTSLMLGRPRTDFAGVWDHSLSLFPDWIGFRPDRREPTPQLLEIYRRGNVSTHNCLRTSSTTLDDMPEEGG